MYKIILVSILLMSSLIAFGQTKDSLSLADETIYEKVDTVASFPGGKEAWYKFISYNFDASVGIENGAKKGTYEIKVRFTVTKDGTLKDFEHITNYKHGLESKVWAIFGWSCRTDH